ncbi:MAG: MBL fold metallo-hydrolase, partial [Oscillospiraceae bacterium]|nr:MBL fold metallo-hydrolase [Oscillospiraceae bacterium]
MKLTFLGAAHEVTGSCTLLEADGKKILIDCGMEQGKDTFVNQELPVSAGEIDLVLLTHAHIDHSGKIPLLVKQGFSGSIYTTEATSDLCRIMLMDSAHIQESEAAWRSKKAARAGKEPVEPLYDTMDAQRALSLLRPCAYGEKIRVSEGIEISFTDVGHLLGSAAISIFITENGITKTLVCSGDVGNTGQPLLRDPQQVKEADYLLLETTYAGRFHGKKPDYIALLTQYLQETFDRGDNVVIPSFAVGRTQEFLYFLRQIKEEGRIKGHDHFPVYVD